jgi:ATP-dependent Clp protease adaptor protein ClpS
VHPLATLAAHLNLQEFSMEANTQTETTVRMDVPSMWRVILHNDDYTPMEFVVQLLIHEFHKSRDEAEALMMAVHTQGSAQAGLFTKEVAVTKAKRSRDLALRFQHPLMVTAEEAN